MTAARGWDPRLEVVGRPIDQIDNELERAVCEAIYRSRSQRWQRRMIGLFLGLKHGLRGLLFSWPLYLMGVAALVLPAEGSPWLGLFLLPGLWVSGQILYRGVREDYRRFVHRILLKPGALRHILLPDF